MLGKGRGGLEQAALDYHEALALGGVSVTSVLHKSAAMREAFDAVGARYETIAPFAEWDPFISGILRKFASEADAIIAHGNRAISIALNACKGKTPVIGVAHNYSIEKRFPKLDGAFCITRDLAEACKSLGLRDEKVFHIPNLIRTHQSTPRNSFRSPVVIGTMARFVSKKGVDVFLQSLKGLIVENVSFKAIIGGTGEEEEKLKGLTHLLGLTGHVEFTGWIEDKQAFYESIDIFVLPSHHEPFGIVLIEAMEQGLPCITTASEGPLEIVTPDYDALLIAKNDPLKMTEQLKRLISDPQKAIALGRAARKTAESRYDISVISRQLVTALKSFQ